MHMHIPSSHHPQLNHMHSRPIEIKYWDHFPEDIGGKLSSRHRLAVAEVVDDFDFFISIEGAKQEEYMWSWCCGQNKMQYKC